MATNSAIEKELLLILDTLHAYPDGISLQQIKDYSGIDLEVRSLQRRLDKLRERGAVVLSGNTRAVTYKPTLFLARETNPTAYRPLADKQEGFEIPLSAVSISLRTALAKPVHQRIPVGYKTDFLLSYRPNVDSYLNERDKKRLAEVGRTNARDQPAGTYVRSVLERLLIDLSWNSSRLEGNTYSLLDTQYLLSQGRLADDKNVGDAQMILNHKEAIEFIVQGDADIGLNVYTITNLHGLLSNNLLPNPAASGRLRSFAVGISNSVFTPLAIPQLVEDMFRTVLAKADAIEDPFEQAFFLMVHLPYLQPFDDVNKRVSRLAANIPLNKHNLSPLAFVDVPEELYIKGLLAVYELNNVALLKDVFMWSYERSALRYAAIKQSLGEPDQWRMQYKDEIRELVGQVVKQTMKQDEAALVIAQYAQRIADYDRLKFIEIVDTELLSLHEGNFARFRIRPAEFARWQQAWIVNK